MVSEKELISIHSDDLDEVKRRVDIPDQLFKVCFRVKEGPLLEMGGVEGLNKRLFSALLPVLQATGNFRSSMVVECLDEGIWLPLESRLAHEVGRGMIAVQASSLVQLAGQEEWEMTEKDSLVRPAGKKGPGKTIMIWRKEVFPFTWVKIEEDINGSSAGLSSFWYARHENLPVIICDDRPKQLPWGGVSAVILPGTRRRDLLKQRAQALEVIRKNPSFFQEALLSW